ncbi:hypothetical protein GH714_022319 [Hevea brasiliensis]|uniref:Leucine-rich repeat-containing N-terminal plant-type domain-containing protein n=1 Tax=Hevea brasiliensis TaxID=3981 RepID=A0A6A6KY89_HEVBR|nr:hypothetical protein GH714_022319 [Hevea brasiliensis]
MESSFYGLLLSILFFFHLSALTHSFNSSLQLRCHDDEDWPCFNSNKASSYLILVTILMAIQNWNHGNSFMEKEVTAAYGMVWSVTTKLIMSSALTLVAVVFLDLSTPIAPSSALFIFIPLILPTTTSTLKYHLKLISLVLSYDLKLHKPSLRDLLQKFTNLKELHLDGVNISSTVPDTLTNLSSLESLALRYGGLQGPIVLQWVHLTILDIQSNMLQGSLLSIPVSSNNYFNGSTSAAWRNGCNLKFINLSHNRLQGQLPRALANCSKKVGTGKFSKLQIIDLSQNIFTGDLPTTYFEIWNAMKIMDTSRMTYMGEILSVPFPFYAYYYDYSITISNKGLELEYLQIPSTLTAIDFSRNRFEGAIPNVIGNLTALHLLNLSNNMLTGHIPSSLANMKELECLDLSSNRLSGQVPLQLSELTSLSSFNVSWNNLSGPVPQGKQFDTFDSNSYKGNSGLCGALLEKKCGNFETIPSSPSTFTEDENSGSFLKINWMIILIGYAGGLIVGVVDVNEFTKRKHDWFVKTFGRKLLKRQRKKNIRN